MTTQSERLAISVIELAEQLGIGKTIAYQLVKRDDFPSVRIGDRILIPVDGLREWLKQGCKIPMKRDNPPKIKKNPKA